MLRWLWSPDGPHGHRMLPLGTAPGLQTNSAQCQSETDTTRKHRAVSSEILRKGRNNILKTAKKVLSSYPITHSLLLWSCDCVTWPQARHTRDRVWPLLDCLCPGGLQSWREPHIIGFVVCANYIRHQSPLSGHYPIQTQISCLRAVITTRIRAGQWTLEAEIVLLQVNASFMI